MLPLSLAERTRLESALARLSSSQNDAVGVNHSAPMSAFMFRPHSLADRPATGQVVMSDWQASMPCGPADDLKIGDNLILQNWLHAERNDRFPSGTHIALSSAGAPGAARI